MSVFTRALLVEAIFTVLPVTSCIESADAKTEGEIDSTLSPMLANSSPVLMSSPENLTVFYGYTIYFDFGFPITTSAFELLESPAS